MLIDTHTHLYLRHFDHDRDDMMRRAVANGVSVCYLPNVDSTTTDAMLTLEAAWPDRCFAMMGIHPCSINQDFEQELSHARGWLDRRTFVAIGEIGMDLHWDKTHQKEQESAFRTQIQWAIEFGLPIVIHSRNATDECLDIVADEYQTGLTGIFHCFSGSMEQAQRAVDLDFYLGIGGVLTYKNSAGLDDIVREITLDRLVLETDSPYLPPVPHRGKRNESAYLRFVAEKMAQLRGVDLRTIAEATTKNAQKIFSKIPISTGVIG